MSYYARKSPRIPNYDYSRENYYFITICTHNRRCLFGTVSELNQIGKIVDEHIRLISSHYEDVYVEKYVVMPNHVHLIFVLNSNGKLGADQIIGQYKSGVTREVRKLFPGMVLWQRSFHDRVIRTQKSFEKIWLYIEGNPQCWEKDCFYIDPTIETTQ